MPHPVKAAELHMYDKQRGNWLWNSIFSFDEWFGQELVIVPSAAFKSWTLPSVKICQKWNLKPNWPQDFAHDKDKPAGFFTIVTTSERNFLYVCSGLHNLFSYVEDEKKELSKTFRIEEVIISQFSGFMANNYLHHGSVK